MRKLQDAGNPIAGKDLLHARKMREKVCEIGCNFGPRFGTEFWLQFWRPFFQIIVIGPKTGPKLVPKLGPKLQPLSRTFSFIFRACGKSLPASCPRFATFAFLARILACVLRRPTTSSYLGGSLVATFFVLSRPPNLDLPSLVTCCARRAAMQ